MYYRYNFIIDAHGSIHGRHYEVTVHSLFFSFSRDVELTYIAQNKAMEIYNRIVPDWFTRDIGEGWEEVESSEAKGIGFYYLQILVNDEIVRKIHLRRRFRGRSFFGMVLRPVYGLLKRLL